MNSWLQDPRFYAIVVVVGGALGGLLKSYIERRIRAGIDNQFALRLERHKHDLQLAIETAKVDLQAGLTNLTHYTTKKHAVSAEVYAALRVAHGTALNLRGIRQELTFEEFNRDDLARHM